MLPKLRYLAWAIEHYEHVTFDLATSGMRPLPASAVGDPAALLCGAADALAGRRWVEAIAARFGVEADEVVPTLGTTHAIWAAYAATLDAGDEVLVEAPGYEPLVRAAEGIGARVVRFARDLVTGAIDLGDVDRMLGARTKLVVVTNLHNPSGAYLADDAVRVLAERAARVGAFVLSDEVYRDLVDFDPSRGRTAFRVAPNVVTVSSLSKVYGLPWARAGWALAPRELGEKMRAATLHDVGGPSHALASMGTVALGHLGHLHRISVEARANDARNAQALAAFVAARPHLAFTPHLPSIFGFVRDRRGVDLLPTIERAIAEEQVVVAAGGFFDEPSGFRIRYGAIEPSTFDEGLARLGRVLDRS